MKVVKLVFLKEIYLNTQQVKSYVADIQMDYVATLSSTLLYDYHFIEENCSYPRSQFCSLNY